MSARELNIKTKKKVNNAIFDLNLKINGEGAGFSGQDLWKLGVWGSCNADGEGERISYQEQASINPRANGKRPMTNFVLRLQPNANTVEYVFES